LIKILRRICFFGDFFRRLGHNEGNSSVKTKYTDILSLLNIKPSFQSIDYVKNKKPFQLHTLLTEQRHPRTWNLSSAIKDDVGKGLQQILSVEEDISKNFHLMAESTLLLDQAAHAVYRAIKERRKIFIYGCGSTGRLAKQMESALWRPFWRSIKKGPLWDKLKPVLPEDVEDRLIGEMTGGDRALISALEGFEDLQLVGKLQLKDKGIEKGDAVFCITEGGETSSVIGAMQAACDQYGKLTKDNIADAKNHLYFLYNNPDDMLKPLGRSCSVIENPAVTKINLATGPQAITGSTRMQAATSETYIMGIVLEAGIQKLMKDLLSEEEASLLGFASWTSMKERLLSFDKIRKRLMSLLKDLGKFTLLESMTYRKGKRATYFAKKALITVFIDCAERSPTFHLYPLDRADEKERRSWLQVWTEAGDYKHAWQSLLGRDFSGLDKPLYKRYFLSQIGDHYLRETALKSLSQADPDQEKLYDFSFSRENVERRGPQEGDLGVLVCQDEEIDELAAPDSSSSRFISLFKQKNASIALVLVSNKNPQEVKNIVRLLPVAEDKDVVITFTMDRTDDPLKLRRQIAIKILLNAHSTGVMARIGKVVGNTMTNVNPSNLKLIGRATYLIMSHVNDVISKREWIKKNGKTDLITYAQANAVLFAAMDFVAELAGETSEVELSIIRIIEALRKRSFASWEKALSISETTGLENYLEKHNPSGQR
jgi:N-acetylmuramic acid 6-phosphate etherase